ncbi:MAG TPA: arginine repressor [Clostridia bacterium]|nr:arginine repressor [Clostridia bacterium]
MKAVRHSKILELITTKEIKTQEELTKELRKRGMKVTQATVSRDIKQMGLIKVPAGNGEHKYVPASPYDDFLIDKLVSILSASIVSLDIVEKIIVVKTISGAASAAAEAIDSIKYDGIVGTLAGNNSIFILARNEEKAKGAYRYIENLMKIKNS